MPVYPLKNEAPSWQIPSAQVNTELTKFHKKETPTVQLRSHFQGILEQYTCAETIYTDGSKTASGVGCSIIINGVAHLWTLPPMTSIFTAEQYAILQALKYCQIESKSNLTLIVSDSLSTLNAMSNRYSRDPLILACLQTLKVLMDGDKRVVFIWVPGHVGILGNELADQSARQAAAATGIDCTIVKAPDLKMKIRQCITEAWQRQWNNELTQLRTIKPDRAPYDTPPWTRSKPHIDIRLSVFLKNETAPQVYLARFKQITDHLHDHLFIYSDGSKSSTGVGASIAVNSVCHMWSLDPISSIFTAECYAIWQALLFFALSSSLACSIVSDSLSVISSTGNNFTKDERISRILNLTSSLENDHKKVRFIWVPSHVNIIGNELADAAAKQAATMPPDEGIPTPLSDYVKHLKDTQNKHGSTKGTYMTDT
ncbi:unnamed protein product [Acanthoscelides obtectus]|uniref:ribonuclease H n=1 Tax=Acanthoscelides obtectus TaxID=200917 RepID=A0A9P0VU66_ACAOB|nr:unnamed protein product [Acanthoscelides obtectus]CAK1684171.1 hypothetical protein AOBTE_LOCUS34678 [Acanthoscelides obtectus]